MSDVTAGARLHGGSGALRAGVFLGLFAALFAALIFAIGAGRFSVSPGRIAEIILAWIAAPTAPLETIDQRIVLLVRMPRVLIAGHLVERSREERLPAFVLCCITSGPSCCERTLCRSSRRLY